MDIVQITDEVRQFHLHEEVIPGSDLAVRYAHRMPFHNHGRAIARDAQGNWYCAFISCREFGGKGSWLGIATGPAHSTVGGEFAPIVWLTGRSHPHGDPLFVDEDAALRNVCLHAEDEQLQVVYDDGRHIRQATLSAGSDCAEAANWQAPSIVATDFALCDLSRTTDHELILYATRGGDLYELAKHAEPTRICADAEHAVVFIAPSGRRHLAFERNRRIYYLTSLNGAEWRDSNGSSEPELVAHFCSSWPSIVALANGTVVIAYQGEGKADLRRMPELYERLRPGAGSTVSYAVGVNGKWHLYDHLRSSEILLKRRASSSLPAVSDGGLFRAHLEEFWRPALSLDCHGVLWLFFLNTTRRHVYCSRFTGERFGTHLEARGAYDCLSRQYFVQKECRGPRLGFLVHAANQLYFDALTIPVPRSADRRRIVFLDCLEIDEMIGIEQQRGQWQKIGPLPFQHPTSDDPRDSYPAWCQVVREDDKFVMRYMSQGRERSNWMPGRASSSDGLAWQIEAPYAMSQLTLDGGAFPNNFWRPVFLEDAEAESPQQRFKGVLGDYRIVHGVELRVWRAVTSPDARNWHTVPGLGAVATGDISVNSHIFRDDDDPDPARRFKLMLLMGAHAGRAAVLFTSPDALHWRRLIWLRENPDRLASPLSPYPTGPIIIDPDGGESPWEEEIHDAVLWRENGLLMAHYDAFYFHFNQHTNKALAVSRDGRHFHRVLRGAVDLPHGNCGEWDSGRDRSSVPIRVGDELWMWFCGMPAAYFADPERIDIEADSWRHPEAALELRPWGLGLAKLRLDGWGFVQRERLRPGYLTTVPIDYAGGQLLVNGSGLAGLQVEFRNADNDRSLAGFTAADSEVAGSDSVAARVTWPGGMPDHGRWRLRFYLNAIETRLYAFGFEPAD